MYPCQCDGALQTMDRTGPYVCMKTVAPVQFYDKTAPLLGPRKTMKQNCIPISFVYSPRFPSQSSINYKFSDINQIAHLQDKRSGTDSLQIFLEKRNK